MKRLIAGSIAVAALVFSMAGSVNAASGNQSVPGTPLTPNCVGQTNAFIAQSGTVEGVHGIDSFADATGLTVQQVEAIVQAYCAGQLP